ncbi:pathogen-associated molecular patterns-induced protein A70-like [Lolium rigidum]|uniref:pathogen-associated molecular patterns-induced protein A70-like n=1 Tax=Lolium rigidum TaxID=89674 RepID=UPI001F5CA85C|nr:pathogen-associated molecular patterns-induced protein A70-like [Lolium rigidum]
MDRAADATAAALGAWASVRGFFTPATLFIVVNLVIGTIALSSRFQQRRRRGNAYNDDGQHHEQQQQPFHHPQAQHHQEDRYYDDQQRHHEQQQQQYVPPQPAPLARTSSVLDRLRSIGLYRFRSGDFPPEYAAGADSTASPAPDSGDAHHARSRSEPAPAPAREVRRRPKKSSRSDTRFNPEVAPPPAVQPAVLEEDDDDEEEYARADEFTDTNFATQPLQQEEEHLYREEYEEQYYREEYVPPPRPAPLPRAPSVLERLRSFSLSRFRSGEVAADDAAAAVAELERSHHAAQYSRSRSEPSREQSAKGKKLQQDSAEARMSKSSSVARKPAPVEPEAEVGGVDARADDFINSFRKQLQLQRLNSLLNYKDMLNRGA